MLCLVKVDDRRKSLWHFCILHFHSQQICFFANLCDELFSDINSAVYHLFSGCILKLFLFYWSYLDLLI